MLLRLTTGVRLSEIKRAAEEQCLWLSFEGDQRWWCDDVRWQIVANASCRDFEGIVADRDAMHGAIPCRQRKMSTAVALVASEGHGAVV